MLQTTDLEFGRPGGFTLTTPSLAIAPRRILGILGPNGSGKSTFLQLLTGTLKPTTGTVTWEGKTRRQWGPRKWARHVAMVPQETDSLPDLYVRDYVALGLVPHQGVFGAGTQAGYSTVTEAMHTCNVTHLENRRFAALSGGQRQRVRIAKALAQTPKILILDEPSNHLDLQAIEHLSQLLQTLANQGLALVISMHDLDLASVLTHEVLILQQGQAQANGTTEQVLTPKTIKRCWGVDVLTLDDGLRTRYILKY